jgi:hypothetical protein
LPGITQHSLAIEPIVAQRMQELAAAGRHLTAPLAGKPRCTPWMPTRVAWSTACTAAWG